MKPERCKSVLVRLYADTATTADNVMKALIIERRTLPNTSPTEVSRMKAFDNAFRAKLDAYLHGSGHVDIDVIRAQLTQEEFERAKTVENLRAELFVKAITGASSLPADKDSKIKVWYPFRHPK